MVLLLDKFDEKPLNILDYETSEAYEKFKILYQVVGFAGRDTDANHHWPILS